MPRELALAAVQEWMQAVIVHPGEVEAALAAPGAARLVPAGATAEVVRASATLTPGERVGIYHGMYLLRMAEALEADYPLMRRFLGEERFTALVRDYVQAYPSRSYTLNRLGDHLPRFVAAWDDAGAPFLEDLARFELAMTEVFDAEESTALDAAGLEQLGAAGWDTARLAPAATLRLVATRYDMGTHLEAYHADAPAPRPRRRASFYALFRRDFAVRRRDLSRAEHDLLAALVAGEPLGVALGVVRAKDRERVFGWFRTWVADGFFAVPA